MPWWSNGVRVAAGSRVRLRPDRRADAQDIFFAGKSARVTSVHEDVDGEQHVAVIVVDDPAADMHDCVRPLSVLRAGRSRTARRHEQSARIGVHDGRSRLGRNGVVAVVVVGGVLVGLRSIPDMRRYMKMRNM